MADTPRALRLRFEYAGGVLRLVSTTAVDAVVPPGDAPAGSGGEAGFWLELRDAADRALFRRVLHDPLATDREAFAPDPSKPVARAPGAAGAPRVFSVMVPEVPEAVAVALFSSEHQGGGTAPGGQGVLVAPAPGGRGGRFQSRAAQPVARFALRR